MANLGSLPAAGDAISVSGMHAQARVEGRQVRVGRGEHVPDDLAARGTVAEVTRDARSSATSC